MIKAIAEDRLKGLIEALKRKGYRIIAPKELEKGLTLYREVESMDEVNREALLPRMSFKEYLLPRCEPILTYASKDGNITLQEAEVEAPKTIIFGSRPCDAASLPILEQLFSWDYIDPFFAQRRANTLVLSFSCPSFDEYCFCTSLGLSPTSKEGSDILFRPGPEGKYIAEAITEAGKALMEELKDLFEEAQGLSPRESPAPPIRFDIERIKPWLDSHFESPYWWDKGVRCLGCGCCSFLCPTCHCFDIVDESNYQEGLRLKNWDCCSFSCFTVHTSGHNPRPEQHNRYRQRVMHKFKYYPEKFGYRSCLGCGRCARWCPVDINLREILKEIPEVP